MFTAMNVPTNCIHIIIIIYTSIDEKQNYTEESPQHKIDMLETFVNSRLLEACRKGNLSRVRLILSKGLVDINSRDEKHGRTPLMVAAHGGHCEIFDFLMSKGANMSDVDYDCKNVLHWACKGGHVDMVERVLPQYGVVKGKEIPPLLHAAWSGYSDVLEFLVCTGSNVSQVDVKGNNALHYASLCGHMAVLKYIVSQASVDVNSRNKDGLTPLMMAASSGNRDVFDFLASMGANASYVGDNGHNILHLVSSYGRMKIVKYILSHSLVDVNARDKYGKTAAMIAKRKRKLNVYNLLVSRGCPVK
ncbi:ankyrin repeat domain-containing protein 50-like [Haliotis rubra]|uniref:ankyrin repeat domain-containing protein 50-like n=1 Tax=Haliotis rubra TaxID=36100 RepID=UPI001EE60817|nr:ankyrin repeat domain-containing protein 50-like [Haliotis rubra]